MGKKTILNKITVSAQLRITINKKEKLNDAEYSTIAKFNESIPALIQEVEKNTAVTFLELIGEYHERERKKKKAAKKKK